MPFYSHRSWYRPTVIGISYVNSYSFNDHMLCSFILIVVGIELSFWLSYVYNCLNRFILIRIGFVFKQLYILNMSITFYNYRKRAIFMFKLNNIIVTVICILFKSVNCFFEIVYVKAWTNLLNIMLNQLSDHCSMTL